MVNFALAPTVAFAFWNHPNIPHPRQQRRFSQESSVLSAHSSLVSPYYNYHFDPTTSGQGTSGHFGSSRQATSEASVLTAFEEFQDTSPKSDQSFRDSSTRSDKCKTQLLENRPEQEEQEAEEDNKLEELCQRLGIQSHPSRTNSYHNHNANDNSQQPLLIRLESNPEDDVRGVYLNHPVQKGDLILKVPLEACLLDDEPPLWWSRAKREVSGGPENESFDSFAYKNPSDWAPRLAASLLDLQFQKQQEQNPKDNKVIGQYQWLSFLPNSQYLRASLPVHWSEDILSNARCTALELAADSAYFARAEALGDLQYALKTYGPKAAQDLSAEELQQLCQNALDVVQTRSCRAEPLVVMENNAAAADDGGDDDSTSNNDDKDLEGVRLVGKVNPLRVLAPIFDMINHGSSLGHGDGSANAIFGVEEEDVDSNGLPYLCVRATKNVDANDEVLIDYGDSAKPAWKCLLSYGFVPKYCMPGVDDGDGSHDDEEEEDAVDENVAEVFMDGKRYECGPSTIPVGMVEAAMSFDRNTDDAEEVSLTPEIALKLAKRISTVSYYLLLDDKSRSEKTIDDAYEDFESIEDLMSLQLAASLRWSQHKTLQACAQGLQEWASQ